MAEQVFFLKLAAQFQYQFSRKQVERYLIMSTRPSKLINTKIWGTFYSYEQRSSTQSYNDIKIRLPHFSVNRALVHSTVARQADI